MFRVCMMPIYIYSTIKESYRLKYKVCTLALNLKVTRTSETSVHIKQITWCCSTEDGLFRTTTVRNSGLILFLGGCKTLLVVLHSLSVLECTSTRYVICI
jgi:hypothetical protein